MRFVIFLLAVLIYSNSFAKAKECIVQITDLSPLNHQTYEVKKPVKEYKTKMNFRLPSSQYSSCYLFFYNDVGIAEGGNMISCEFDNLDYIQSDRTALMEPFTTPNQIVFRRNDMFFRIKGFCK